MKKYLKTLTAIIAALALSGCSSGGIAPTTNAGGSAPTTNAGGSASTNSAGAERFEGTDIGGKKGTAADTAGGMLEGDMAAPEAADGALAAEASTASPDDHRFIPDDYIDEPEIPPQSGLLTGGEWNDNAHWADWSALYETHGDWNGYKSDWRIVDGYRLTVTVTSDGKPLEGAKVSCEGCNSAVTDNKGKAYLFSDNMPSDEVSVTCGDKSVNMLAGRFDGERNLSLPCELDGAVSSVSKKLDLMIMCDTTGSMSDELEYLKVELEDIVKSIKSQNANIPTRVSVNFYRDTEDEYEVRQFPFSENIDEVAEAIREQSARGGGDFPEAVHTALDSALNQHDWAEDSVKIMFLVLDAPPHSDAQIIDDVNKYIAQAAEMGIRIIPVASSGIDKSTEYLLRTMAFSTGGTYTFLTDDSGVGGGHIEPTVGAYNVEKLNDMMVRIVSGYLT